MGRPLDRKPVLYLNVKNESNDKSSNSRNGSDQLTHIGRMNKLKNVRKITLNQMNTNC